MNLLRIKRLQTKDERGMKMKKALSLLLALAMLVCFTACGEPKEDAAPSQDGGQSNTEESKAPDTEEPSGEDGEGSKDPGDIEIAFIVKAMSDQFFVDAVAGAEARAQELGIKLTALAPEGGQADIEGEVQIMEDVIIKGVDAIVIDCSDHAALNPTIKQANDAGIPVVLFNDIVDFDDLAALGGHYDSYVGLNSFDAAKQVGEYCSENSEPGKVAILEGLAGIVASQERAEGFVAGLSDEFEVATSQPANWDKNEAYNVIQNILTADPDIKVVWAVNSMMGMGAIQAIKDMGMMDQIDVYDFDCEVDDVAAIKEGTLKATLRYPTKEWAALAVNTAFALVNGETVEKEVYTDVMVVTPDNVDEVSFD
jgi:ribose transport system substrate-binding protein